MKQLDNNQVIDQSNRDRFGLTPEDYDDLYSSVDMNSDEPWWN